MRAIEITYRLPHEHFRMSFSISLGCVNVDETSIESTSDSSNTTLIMPRMKDWHIVEGYLALHAGLLREQYEQSPLVFREANYFVRHQDIPPNKKYLDRYVLVAGHTHLGDEPTIAKGYINIDLGAGYGKHIGAFSVEEHVIIRSDGARFPL